MAPSPSSSSTLTRHALVLILWVSLLLDLSIGFRVVSPLSLIKDREFGIAEFGPPYVHPFGDTGPLVIGHPFDGCTEMLPLTKPNSIVLLQRGQCAFMSKVFHAQNAGAFGVVIMQNDTMPRNTLNNMTHDGTGRSIRIRSVLISKEDVLQLLNFLKNNPDREVIVTLGFTHMQYSLFS